MSHNSLKLFETLELAEPIQAMDVGASAIAEVPVYKPLLEKGLAHLNAFEGDARQIESIQKAYGGHCAYSTELGHSVQSKLDSRSVATRGLFFTPKCWLSSTLPYSF